jgi:hypothetical protein
MTVPAARYAEALTPWRETAPCCGDGCPAIKVGVQRAECALLLVGACAGCTCGETTTRVTRSAVATPRPDGRDLR